MPALYPSGRVNRSNSAGMKYCIIVTSDTGKMIKIVGNEYIDIDILAKNKRIAALTVRDNAVFDSADHDIAAPRCTDHDEIEKRGLHGY